MMMKAVALLKDGSAEITDIARPEAKRGEVLVRVEYSALDSAYEEVASRTFIPGSLLHNLRASPLVAGWHFSGTVEGKGDGTAGLKVGDEVFGHLQYHGSTRQGSLSEYITVPADECSKVPDGISLTTAAAAPTEALTALQGLRKAGALEGKRVLVVAAGGGVGFPSIQIAKALKASEVTGICSTKDVGRVKGHADDVIDRTEIDITKQLADKKYDVIYETSGKYSIFQLKYALKRGGTFVSTIPSPLNMPPLSYLVKALTGRTYATLMVQCNRPDLETVGGWLATGALEVPIDCTHGVKEIAAARERNSSPKKRGRVVIKVKGGW